MYKYNHSRITTAVAPLGHDQQLVCTRITDNSADTRCRNQDHAFQHSTTQQHNVLGLSIMFPMSTYALELQSLFRKTHTISEY